MQSIFESHVEAPFVAGVDNERFNNQKGETKIIVLVKTHG